MSKVSQNHTDGATVKKGFNFKKVGGLIIAITVIAIGIYAFGFTTKGQTIVRVMIDPTPAGDAYAAKDVWVNQFELQVASPKAN